MRRKIMNTPDKRRGPSTAESRSPSRVPRKSNSPPTSSSAAAATSTPAKGSVISPPPRAALSGTSTPTPDQHRSRTNSTSGSASNPSKDAPPGSSGHSASGNSAGGIISNGAGGPPASAAATQHLLREKDARISHLEREMDIMEGEFQRELDKLSANESETAAFWQAKHSALNQQFLRTDTELRLLRAEVEVREAEREELKAGWEVMRRQLRDRDEEARILKGQVRGLKEWVSTSTRSDGQTQTSDEVFGEGMARLGNGLQNWVIVNFRKAKIDLSQAREPVLAELGRLVPMYEELRQSSKVNLLQSLVSRLLVELVFDVYFVGLPRDVARQFTQMETFLAAFAESPGPINQWRSLTLNILKKEATQKMQEETSAVIESVIARVNGILDAITDSEANEARNQGLRALVSSAVELSRLLVVQKAVFKVLMPDILPHQKTMFDPATMEDIGGEDEESLSEREICCVTFPGIIKRGDESGAHLQFRNVLAKARVFCTPE